MTWTIWFSNKGWMIKTAAGLYEYRCEWLKISQNPNSTGYRCRTTASLGSYL